MRSILVFFITIEILFFSASAFALGLGNLQMHSGLGEPLRAEIEITNLGNTPLEQVTAGMAPNDLFQEIGMPVPDNQLALTFKTERNAAGLPILSIESQSPVQDPYLSFLVDVHWPQGRLVRKYTMLLNPPGFNEKIDQATAEQVTNPTDKVVHRTYGPVQRDQHLWQIAREVRPDNTVSLREVVAAIYKANPGAFLQGNVDSLRPGVTLVIPTKAEMLANAVHAIVPANPAPPEKTEVMVKTMTQPANLSYIPSFEGTTHDMLEQADISRDAITLIRSQENESYVQPLKTIQPVLGVIPSGKDGDIKMFTQELAIAVEALNTAKETNQLLQQKIAALEKRDALLTELVRQQQSQLQAFTNKKAGAVLTTPGVTTAEKDDVHSSNHGWGMLFVMFGVLVVGGGVVFLLYRYRDRFASLKSFNLSNWRPSVFKQQNTEPSVSESVAPVAMAETVTAKNTDATENIETTETPIEADSADQIAEVSSVPVDTHEKYKPPIVVRPIEAEVEGVSSSETVTASESPNEFSMDEPVEETTAVEDVTELDANQLDVSTADPFDQIDTSASEETDNEIEFESLDTGNGDSLELSAGENGNTEDTENGNDENDEDSFVADEESILEAKLSLARTYISINKKQEAMKLLKDVQTKGNETQQQEAKKLLDSLQS